MRLLQSRQCGGLQADITDFYAWVRAVAQYNPSAGWVAGVVGVHPWEIALCDAQLQGEIFGKDADTWVASPYAPCGRAKAVEDGFVLSGEWPYSTGTSVVGKSDPFQQEALAEAESDLAAGIAHLDLISHKMLAHLRNGQAMNVTMRLDFRRNGS